MPFVISSGPQKRAKVIMITILKYLEPPDFNIDVNLASTRARAVL